MKKLILLLIFLVSFLVSQEIKVDERISDIYFANGILTTEKQAWEASKLISDATKKDIYNGNTAEMKRFTNFDLLYNNTYGFYADVLEMFNQKKAEHKYFWITIESIINIAGKTTKIGIATDAAKDKLADMIAQEILKAMRDMAITYVLDEADLGAYQNVIYAIEEALKKNTFSYTWNIINAASDVLKEIDLNNQFEALTTGITSGHQAIIIAHSQGNFFVNEIENKFDVQDKTWMKQYIKSISVSSPANKVAFEGSHITYDNDPTTNWPDRVRGDTSNPLRYGRFYLQYNYNRPLSDEDALDIINDIKAMSMPEECNASIGYYFENDFPDLCYNNANIATLDIPNSKFHDFEYYMQEHIVSDIGNIYQNPSRKVVTDFIKEHITSFKTAASQWEVIEKQDSDIKVCEDKLLKAKHKYDNSIKDMDKVYPFDKEGKVYLVNSEYVKTNSLDGVKIEEPKNSEACYKLNDKDEKLIGKIDGIPAKQIDLVIVEDSAIRDSWYADVKIMDYSVQIDGAILREITGRWYIYVSNYDYEEHANMVYPIYASSPFDFDNANLYLDITLMIGGGCSPIFKIPLTMLAANNGHIADLKFNKKGGLTIYSNFKPSSWRDNSRRTLSTLVDYRDICENKSWIYEYL
ncbi:MAG: hypothetical protein LBI78_02435 [Campylobacteraceae bacterium]|jgi:hypothetical protein|nr:hypothetical protein [Campylobacteraceae bacterium]